MFLSDAAFKPCATKIQHLLRTNHKPGLYAEYLQTHFRWKASKNPFSVVNSKPVFLMRGSVCDNAFCDKVLSESPTKQTKVRIFAWEISITYVGICKTRFVIERMINWEYKRKVTKRPSTRASRFSWLVIAWVVISLIERFWFTWVSKIF